MSLTSNTLSNHPGHFDFLLSEAGFLLIPDIGLMNERLFFIQTRSIWGIYICLSETSRENKSNSALYHSPRTLPPHICIRFPLWNSYTGSGICRDSLGRRSLEIRNLCCSIIASPHLLLEIVIMFKTSIVTVWLSQ